MFKRSILLFLTTVLIIGLVGCDSSKKQPANNESDSHPKRPVEETTAKEEKESMEFLDSPMDWSGPNGFTIVYPKGNTENKKTAEALKDFFEAKSINISVVSDDAKESKKEILIGKTNRSESNLELKENEYTVTVTNDKLVISGGHDVTVNKAAFQYMNQTQPDNKVYTFKAESDFASTRLDNYKYVWGDEFETKTLDMTKWMIGADMVPDPGAIYIDDPSVLQVENSLLKMTAKRYFDPNDMQTEYATSPSISTQGTMNFKQGYVEMRAKIPFGRGAWPSLWCKSLGTLSPKTASDYFVEVDIFENFASASRLTPNIHKWYGNGEHSQYTLDDKKTYEIKTDLKGYHIIGCEWNEKNINMFVDGEMYMSFDLNKNFDNKSNMNGFKNMSLYLILNNAIFMDSAAWKPYEGAAIRPENVPYEYFVDLVRLYQKPNTGALYTAK